MATFPQVAVMLCLIMTNLPAPNVPARRGHPLGDDGFKTVGWAKAILRCDLVGWIWLGFGVGWIPTNDERRPTMMVAVGFRLGGYPMVGQRGGVICFLGCLMMLRWP